MFLKDYDIPRSKKFDIFITKREGGFSTWKYESLNLGINSWDDENVVLQNRQFLAQVLWRNIKNFPYLKQVHKWEILAVDENNMWEEIWEYDALITNQRLLIPTILVADCVPIVVYDEEKEVFWVIHSGWRSTAENIMKNTIEKMQEHFSCDKQNIRVIIWPCISAQNYEVDDVVIQHFSEEFYEKNENWWYQLDLRKCVESQAIWAWCDSKNIYHIDNCTLTDSKNFFSARRDGLESWRFSMGVYAK